MTAAYRRGMIIGVIIRAAVIPVIALIAGASWQQSLLIFLPTLVLSAVIVEWD